MPSKLSMCKMNLFHLQITVCKLYSKQLTRTRFRVGLCQAKPLWYMDKAHVCAMLANTILVQIARYCHDKHVAFSTILVRTCSSESNIGTEQCKNMLRKVAENIHSLALLCLAFYWVSAWHHLWIRSCKNHRNALLCCNAFTICRTKYCCGFLTLGTCFCQSLELMCRKSISACRINQDFKPSKQLFAAAILETCTRSL